MIFLTLYQMFCWPVRRIFKSSLFIVFSESFKKSNFLQNQVNTTILSYWLRPIAYFLSQNKSSTKTTYIFFVPQGKARWRHSRKHDTVLYRLFPFPIRTRFSSFGLPTGLKYWWVIVSLFRSKYPWVTVCTLMEV